MSAFVQARVETALTIVRITVAVLIFIHGAARALLGGVPPFGEWLESIGFPMGIAWAGVVTAYELIAPIFIVLGRLVTWACLGHVFILTLGLILVHAPAGWFVVGLGRNGVEYSVLLIVALLAVAYAHAPFDIGRKANG